jgi:tRNA 2-thiouridine synthesizing protein B
MLHTVNKSPFESDAFDTLLRYVSSGSAVLLIEDGVYGAMSGTAVTPKLQIAMKSAPVYALKPDVEARGIQGRVLDGVKLVDYSGFVDLVAEHNTVHAWL